MKLTLGRFEDDEWRLSRGMWLIKEIPGFYIEKGGAGWRLLCFARDSSQWKPQVTQIPGPMEPRDFNNHDCREAECILRAWGENFQPNTDLFLSLPPHLQRDKNFKTRRALLDTLENHLAQKPESTLSELLYKDRVN